MGQEYLNEHLFIGNFGHFLVVLAFVASIVSAIFYLFKDEIGSKLNLRLARGVFGIHVLSVIGVFVTLFLIIQNHYFEYHYAWDHSSTQLPLKYMVSCFWEGQEGSFLLWIVWNAILGVILMFTSKKWERGVMPILILSQIVLLSMLLGVQLTDSYTLGSSPFELLREKMADKAPIFSQPDYLKFIKDGNGLNPLLQNYWMVIHPPTLFLGFALTIVPFAFAVTGLQRRDHRGWIKPALPWALIAGMILGTGIIMGGFWAYESLSFGGYWAWDPVENASLVPWLLLIAGIHLMIIKKTTNTSTIAAYILVISSFILVLYATFLTRSGVLGDTSVHSFTDLGLAGQLMQFVVLFVWLPIIAVTRSNKIRWSLLIPIIILTVLLPFQTKLSFYPILIFSLAGIGYFALSINKELDNKPSEDSTWSREFWMFIGSLILLLSAIQITVTTSIPVFNKILGTSAAPPSDVIGHYNKFQLPIAVVILLLTSFGQYLHYKKTPDKMRFSRDLLAILGLSVVLTIGGIFLFKISRPLLIVLMLASIYSFSANLFYLIGRLKAKIKFGGASVAHLGFAMMILGVLVSSDKKQVITADFTGSMQNFDESSRRENMLLMLDEPSRLGNYWVTYEGDSTHNEDIFFKVHYVSMDSTEEFTLYPNAQIGQNEGLMANPDTRHYLTYDVYTHITSIPKPPDSLSWSEPVEHIVKPGDTIQSKNGTIYFKGIEQTRDEELIGNATLVKAVVEIDAGYKKVEGAPVFVIMDNNQAFFSIRQELPDVGLRLGFTIRPEDTGTNAIIEVAETDPQPKYIVMKGIIFPYINLLWLGTIIMVFGFGLAAFQRLELKRGK